MLPEEIAKETQDGDLYINPENLDNETPPEVTEPKEAEPAEPVAKADDKASKEEVKEEPKPERKGVQGRIDELTKARRIAERRAELAEAKIAELEKAGKLDPDQFEDAAEHAAAVARAEGTKSAYAAKKEDAEAELAEVDKETRDLLIEDWTEAVEDAKKAIPDFEEVLSKSKSPLPPHVERAILESGALGPKIAYHLAKNTAEAIHISRLSPLALGRELARLEIRLQNTSAPAVVVPKVTAAPAPIAPLSAKGSAANADTDDFEAWKAKRNKERNFR